MNKKQLPDSIYKILRKIPAWSFTILCLAAILWLTLAPDPLGDNELPLFPGADKICHAIMFGGFVWCILFDAERRKWILPSTNVYIRAVCASAILGILTEWLQHLMNVGRSYDSLDYIADLAGALIFALLYIPIGKWLKPSDN